MLMSVDYKTCGHCPLRASPVAYYVLNNWLSALPTGRISWWIFALAR